MLQMEVGIIENDKKNENLDFSVWKKHETTITYEFQRNFMVSRESASH